MIQTRLGWRYHQREYHQSTDGFKNYIQAEKKIKYSEQANYIVPLPYI